MLPAILLIHILLLPPIATPSSLPALTHFIHPTPPPALLPSSSNLTARTNQVRRRRDPDLRPPERLLDPHPFPLPHVRPPPGPSRPRPSGAVGDFRQWGAGKRTPGGLLRAGGGRGPRRTSFPWRRCWGSAIWAPGEVLFGRGRGEECLG